MQNNIQPVIQRFKLDQATIDELKSRTPNFGFNGLGELVFRRTYSRDNENWSDVVTRVIEGTMSIRKEHFYRNSLRWEDSDWQEYANNMALSLFEMEWLPPGRGLWMMGTEFTYQRGSMALNNCFRRDTTFWTDKGLKSFNDFNDGDSVVVRGQNKWMPATIKCFEEQQLVELTVGKKGQRKTIYTTDNHRWLAKTKKGDGKYSFKIKTTNELEPEWKLQNFAKRTNFHAQEMCPVGIQHGIVFGDGTLHKNTNNCAIELIGEKQLELSKYFFTTRKDNRTITGLPNTWKTLPDLNMNKEYLFGFLAGWFATDGTIDSRNGSLTITNKDKSTLEWLRNAFFKVDIQTCEIHKCADTNPYDNSDRELYRVTICRDNLPAKFFIRDSQLEKFIPSKETPYWRVIDVKYTNIKEKVWCVVEPEFEEFTLECGILTKNCAATDTKDDLVLSAEWAMDALMNGVGVGFSTHWRGSATAPNKEDAEVFVIPDSREGWVESLIKLLCSYINSPRHGTNKFTKFDYSKIRESGEQIKGFGGTSSGSGPLKQLHERVEGYLDAFCIGRLQCKSKTWKEFDGEWKEIEVEVDKPYSHTRLVADIFNAIGACVVAGNVRRSAEICLGSVDDEDFINLKNYEMNPERSSIGWMSNNSVVLKADQDYEDFSYIPDMARRIIDNGEPGMINLYNIQKYGRFGKERPDEATLVNPCGEIPLENFELCNLAESFPTRSTSVDRFYKSLEYATFYATTVSLLPTHRPETNSVIAKNRRIGVSISGIAQWASVNDDIWKQMNYTRLGGYLREGYKIVRDTNTRLAKAAGVPASVRVTTVKPSGSISLVAGVTPGVHYPVSRFAIRRVRIGSNSPITKPLIEAGVRYETDKVSDNTLVFEFVIDHGDVRPCEEVSPWEQFSLVQMLQKHYADNCVSATIYFDKVKDAPDVEKMLAMFIPNLKSVSMLPHSGHGYAQAPYEPITEEEYNRRLAEFKFPKYDSITDNVPSGSKFCSGDTCEL